MLDVLVQIGKMIGILFYWYCILYELPKLLKDGTFHTAFDLIKDVLNQNEYRSGDERSRTTLAKIWVFIDKFLITVPSLVYTIIESYGWFTKAGNDLLIALQNLTN